MTLASAKATAIGMTTRFGADFVVFRLPGWTADEYSVKRADEVPPQAEIAETYTFDRNGATATPSAPEEQEQRGLFE